MTTKLDTTAEDGLSRRQMLKAIAGAGMLLLLPILPGYAQAAGQWTTVGKAADFVKNQPARVALDGGGVLFVTRHSDTELSAMSAKCTHRGCEVGWDQPGAEFKCPCHGAVFAPDGKNVKGPRKNPAQPLDPLLAVPVRQTGDKVEVNLASIAPAALQPGADG